MQAEGKSRVEHCLHTRLHFIGKVDYIFEPLERRWYPVNFLAREKYSIKIK